MVTEQWAKGSCSGVPSVSTTSRWPVFLGGQKQYLSAVCCELVWFLSLCLPTPSFGL